LPLLAPLKKYFWLCLEKSTIGPQLEKILPTPLTDLTVSAKEGISLMCFINSAL